MRLKLDEIKLKFDEMNKKQKMKVLLLACCVGVIILAGISNIVSPDQNTNINNSNDDNSISTTPQEKHYTPNMTDNFTYMGEDCNDYPKMDINMDSQIMKEDTVVLMMILQIKSLKLIIIQKMFTDLNI